MGIHSPEPLTCKVVPDEPDMSQHGNSHPCPVYHTSLQGCSFPCWSYLPGIQPASNTVSEALSQTL